MKKNPQQPIIDIRNYDYLLYKDNDASSKLMKICAEKNLRYFQFTHKFNSEQTNSHFWKYLDLESALLCLRYGNIRFVEPSRWEDKYEGRFYNADYSNICQDSNEYPFLYACCMSHKPHNEAAWKVYSYGKTGLGAHCVQFKINRSRFRFELTKNADNLKFIAEGDVLYYKEAIINDLHKKEIGEKGKKKLNTNYFHFFEDFNFGKYINLLLLKRDYFKHENETRFFLIPQEAPQRKSKKSKGQYGLHKDISIDWGNIIEEVRIDSKCTQLEYDILKEACLELLSPFDEGNAGHNDKIERDKQIKKLTPIKTDIYGKRQNIKF
jgi:hypothetical protein